MIYIYTLTDIYRLSRMGTVLVVNKTSILHLYKVDSTPPLLTSLFRSLDLKNDPVLQHNRAKSRDPLADLKT